MTGLDDRLRSRFAGGLVVEIQPPDDGLRRKLFARGLAAAGVAYDSELVDYLASWSTAGAAELLEMVERLVESAHASGATLDATSARRLLEGDGAAPQAESAAPARSAVTASGSMVALRGNGKAYDAIFLDREKVIWEWPDVAGRAIEELR
jgi:chromosomal replication initiation ATPase DnaA